MTPDNAATLEYALDLWADWVRNDFREVRQLWYPSESAGFAPGGWVRGESAFDELVGESEQRTITIVNTAVLDLPHAMQAALEVSLGLASVVRVRDYEGALADARARVWRALLASNGI